MRSYLTKNFSNLKKEICELFLRTPRQTNIVICACGNDVMVYPSQVDVHLLICPHCQAEIIFSTKFEKNRTILDGYLRTKVSPSDIEYLKMSETRAYNTLTGKLATILYISKDDAERFDVAIITDYVNLFLQQYLLDYQENGLNLTVYKYWV